MTASDYNHLIIIIFAAAYLCTPSFNSWRSFWRVFRLILWTYGKFQFLLIPISLMNFHSLYFWITYSGMGPLTFSFWWSVIFSCIFVICYGILNILFWKNFCKYSKTQVCSYYTNFYTLSLLVDHLDIYIYLNYFLFFIQLLLF